jgi:MGT family glycosyltransferase
MQFIQDAIAARITARYFRSRKTKHQPKKRSMNQIQQQRRILSSVAPGTKVLFANFPADGHFNPLTGLAVHLKNKGCDVRWYTSAAYAEKINRLGIPFYGLNKALDLNGGKNIEAIFPERSKYKSQISKLKFDLVNAFILRGPEYFEDIQEIYEEFEFDVMIADITFGAIPFVKEKMNIPVIAVSVIPLPETSKDLPPSGLGLTPSSGFFGRIKQRVLRYVSDQLIFARPTKIMRSILADYGIDSGRANIFDILIQKSTVVLQSGTPGFEYLRSDMSRHIYFAGPLIPCNGKRRTEKWHNDKLNKYDKVILVTQGTVEKDVNKLLVPALEAFKNSDCLLIVTTGGCQTAQLKAAYPEKNIIIEDFIPFEDVMPYSDVYLSNGGYGGVLLSIKNGLPMVVAGVHEGKNEINARVGFFNLGVNLRTEKPSVLQLRKSVEEVLANPAYARNVAGLREEFNTYNPGLICETHVARLVRQKEKMIVKNRQEEACIY